MMYDCPTHAMFNMPFAIALGIPLVSPSLDKELNAFSTGSEAAAENLADSS
jgi:hypothetical protein